jgi:hypothetical protein
VRRCAHRVDGRKKRSVIATSESESEVSIH